MRNKTKSAGEKIVKDIKRTTRKHYSSEEKIRIVLDGSYLRYPSAVFQHVIDRGQGLHVDGHIMRNPFFKLRNKKLETKYSKKRWPLTPDEFELYRKAAYQEPEQIKL